MVSKIWGTRRKTTAAAHKARRHLPSLACEIIVFLAKVYTYVYTARAKRTERRRYEWYFHIRRHIRDRINTVSAAVYVVSHIGVIYTWRSRVPKPSTSVNLSLLILTERLLSIRVFYLCKKTILCLQEKSACAIILSFFFILIPYLSNNKLWDVRCYWGLFIRCTITHDFNETFFHQFIYSVS